MKMVETWPEFWKEHKFLFKYNNVDNPHKSDDVIREKSLESQKSPAKSCKLPRPSPRLLFFAYRLYQKHNFCLRFRWSTSVHRATKTSECTLTYSRDFIELQKVKFLNLHCVTASLNLFQIFFSLLFSNSRWKVWNANWYVELGVHFSGTLHRLRNSTRRRRVWSTCLHHWVTWDAAKAGVGELETRKNILQCERLSALLLAEDPRWRLGDNVRGFFSTRHSSRSTGFS